MKNQFKKLLKKQLKKLPKKLMLKKLHLKQKKQKNITIKEDEL